MTDDYKQKPEKFQYQNLFSCSQIFTYLYVDKSIGKTLFGKSHCDKALFCWKQITLYKDDRTNENDSLQTAITLKLWSR